MLYVFGLDFIGYYFLSSNHCIMFKVRFGSSLAVIRNRRLNNVALLLRSVQFSSVLPGGMVECIANFGCSVFSVVLLRTLHY